MTIYATKTIESVEIYGCDIDEKLVSFINDELKRRWVKEKNEVECPVYTIEDLEDVWRAHCGFTGISTSYYDVRVTLQYRWNDSHTYETSLYDFLIEYMLDAIDDNWIDCQNSTVIETEYDFDEEIR